MRGEMAKSSFNQEHDLEKMWAEAARIRDNYIYRILVLKSFLNSVEADVRLLISWYSEVEAPTVVQSWYNRRIVGCPGWEGALESLLASLLYPVHVWPPYLSQGLELFRRDVCSANTKRFHDLFGIWPGLILRER